MIINLLTINQHDLTGLAKLFNFFFHINLHLYTRQIILEQSRYPDSNKYVHKILNMPMNPNSAVKLLVKNMKQNKNIALLSNVGQTKLPSFQPEKNPVTARTRDLD